MEVFISTLSVINYISADAGLITRYFIKLTGLFSVRVWIVKELYRTDESINVVVSK